MKREEIRQSAGLLILYRILIAIVLVLVLILAAGTVYALLRPRQAPRVEKTTAGEEAVFSALGTQRISTAGENPETVIVTIAFPYNRSDGPFSEELASRITDFRAQTREYFGSLTAEALRQTDITVINRELLVRYNALLHLGQIKELYFLEYIWL